MREKDGDTPGSGSKMSSALENVQVWIGGSLGSLTALTAHVGLRRQRGDDNIGRVVPVRR